MATIDEVQRFEIEVGRPLPRVYRDFLLSRPASARLEENDAGSVRYVAHRCNLTDDVTRLIHWNRTVRTPGRAWTKEGGGWPEQFVVIGENDRGDYWALDASGDDSSVFIYDRDAGELFRRWNSLEAFAEPAWVARTLRLFPSPVVAIPVAAAFLMLSAFVGLIGISMIVAEETDGLGIAWGLCGLFALPGIMIVCAGIARHRCRSRLAGPNRGGAAVESKPTLAVMALLISVFSWMLWGGMRLARALGANPPGGMKQHVTLAIALASSAFMATYGRRMIHRQFGARGGRGVSLTPRQMIYVTVFVIAIGAYLTWVLE